jgi:ABC-type uncharacterized transport system substrate-binding protein
MTALIRILPAIVGLVLAGAAAAHPHVWVTARSEVVYGADGSIVGIRHHWMFDDVFSAYAVQGLQGKEKGKLSREELAPLAKVNVTSLKDYDYFTYVTVDGKKVLLAAPLPDYWLDYRDAKLTLNFTLPLKQPLKAKDLEVEIYDPTYFIDFELAKPAPVHLVGAAPQCQIAVQWPRELTYAEGKALSNNPEAATNWGAFFANKITVTCP